MDTGSACSRYNIYGQRVYLGSYNMDTYNGLFTSYLLSLLSTIWSVDIYYSMEMKLYTTSGWYLWTLLQRCCYPINGTFTCCIQVILPRQFLHPMSPSSMFVYTQDNASLQSTYLIMLVLLVKLFSSYDTHVPCHVMFYIIACHCII